MKIKHKARHEPDGEHRKNNGQQTEPDGQHGEANGGNTSQEVETSGSALGANDIAPLAYRYWQERGCPEGCPEEDWFRAERELSSATERISAKTERQVLRN